MPQPTIAVKDKDSLPVTIFTINPNGLAAPADSQPVALVNGLIVGAAASIAAINTDLLTGTVNGWYDAAGFQSASFHLLGGAGISAGAIIFEQTNDVTATAAALAAEESNQAALNPLVAAITIAASASRVFAAPIQCRFVRVRTSIAFVGGTVQCVALFRQQPLMRMTTTMQQATAANLNATVASISTSVTPGTAAANLGKARDAVAGATDTGIAMLGIRRDSPTAETPVVGDYVVPQISGKGETWFRDIGAPTPHHAISAASTNATSVKASSGTINNIIVCNLNAAVRFFKLYNKATAPVVGTDTPVLTQAIPAGQSIPIDLGSRGLFLGTGIAYALTTGIAVTDVGAVAANEHAIHMSYE